MTRLRFWRLVHRAAKRLGVGEQWSWDRRLAACVKGEQAVTGW